MKQTLKLSQILIYGLPGLPLAMLGFPLFVYLPSYYSQNLGLSLSAVGLALLFARLSDVFTDPLIGLLNDNWPKSRALLWRRKSYIIMGIPLLIIGLNFLLRPVTDVSALYLFIWSFITYLGWTLINIPWHAIGAEISPNYHEKSALASSREIFSVVGTVTIISLPVLLSMQQNLQSTLVTLANILTLLIPLSLIPLLINVSPKNFRFYNTEINNDSLQPLPDRQKFFSKKSLKALNHPAIKKLLPAYFLNSFANALPATLFILFVTYVLQTPDKIGVLLISYFLSAIIGIPFWLLIAKRKDKNTSWRIALSGSIMSFIWVPFISAGDFIPFLIVCFASGFCLGADVVMPASIQADIAQDISNTEANNSNSNSNSNKNTDSAESSTAMLFGIWGLLTKLALALAVGIAFPILDALGLKVNSLENQSASEIATITLVILYALIPIILKIWVLVKMRSFPFGQPFFTTEISSSEPDISTGNNIRNNINNNSGNNIANNIGNKNEKLKTGHDNRPLSLTSSYDRMQ